MNRWLAVAAGVFVVVLIIIIVLAVFSGELPNGRLE